MAGPYVTNLLENISDGKHVLNPQKGEKISSVRPIGPTLSYWEAWKAGCTSWPQFISAQPI